MIRICDTPGNSSLFTHPYFHRGEGEDDGVPLKTLTPKVTPHPENFVTVENQGSVSPRR